MGTRIILLGVAALLASCNQPKSSGDRALMLSVVSGAVSGSANGVTLRGHFSWQATIQGQNNGISLQGTLR